MSKVKEVTILYQIYKNRKPKYLSGLEGFCEADQIAFLNAEKSAMTSDFTIYKKTIDISYAQTDIQGQKKSIRTIVFTDVRDLSE